MYEHNALGYRFGFGLMIDKGQKQSRKSVIKIRKEESMCIQIIQVT